MLFSLVKNRKLTNSVYQIEALTSRDPFPLKK